MAYSGTAPHIDPRQVRPGRGWYVFAALVTLILVVGGPVIFVLVTSSAIPDLKTRFGGGAPTAVELSADKKWAIYLATPDAESPLVPTRCNAKSLDGGTIALNTPFGYSFSFARGGQTWQLLIQITVGKTGRFEIVCNPGEGSGQQLYAVAEDPQLGGFFGKVAGGIGALIGLPCLGVLVGGIVILIVALRRRSYRNALRQQMSYPPPGYAPPPGHWPPR